jgi:hypothetical protein
VSSSSRFKMKAVDEEIDVNREELKAMLERTREALG